MNLFFHLYFFQKYFKKSKKFDLNNLKPKATNEYEIPLFENFILIVATDNRFELFKETIKKIEGNEI